MEDHFGTVLTANLGIMYMDIWWTHWSCFVYPGI